MLQQESAIAPSDYQRDLDEGIAQPKTPDPKAIRYWSDFNRVFYHPRSVIQINDYELASQLSPFDKWDSGTELFAALDRDEDLLDRDLRPWAEECDHLQAIQIWTGADDAWGGFASGYAERIRDDIGKVELWAWGLEHETTGVARVSGLTVSTRFGALTASIMKPTQMQRTSAATRTIAELSSHASMYIPVRMPRQLPGYINLHGGVEWCSSALLSLAIETMTLPSRLRPDQVLRGSLGDMAAALNVNGNQRVAELHCSIPDPTEFDDSKTKPQKGHDMRMRSQASVLAASTTPQVSFDLDMALSGDDLASAARFRSRSRTHVFGAVTCRRVPSKSRIEVPSCTDEADLGYARKRARFASEPIVES